MKKRHKINSELGWELIVIFALAVITAVCWVSVSGCKQAPMQPPKPPQCKVAVMAFTASWCKPCQRAKKILATIDVPGVFLLIVDVDEDPEWTKEFKITSVPTFLVGVTGELEVTRTHDIAVVVRIVKENLE